MKCQSWCPCKCEQGTCGCHQGYPPRVEREMREMANKPKEKG